MTNREKLQDAYEDALFALLMDDFAREEGERFLRENEALQADPAAAVPEAVNRRCLRTIRLALFRHSHGAALRGMGRTLGRLAIAAVLVIALFTTAFAASASFRTGTLNLLLTFSERAADWQASFSGDKSLSANPNMDLWAKLEQPPEGYEITNTYTSYLGTTVTYTNQAGEEIELSSYLAENRGFDLDIEDLDYYEETMIHGYTAILIDKLGVTSIAWAEEDIGLLVYIDATNLSPEELKALADSVVFD